MQLRSTEAMASLGLVTMPFGLSTLRALENGPRTLETIRDRLGSPPSTTLRGQVRALTDSRAVQKRRLGGFPGGFHYRLTPAGVELIEVAEALSSWLQAGKEAQARPGSADGRRATRLLAGAWKSGIVAALAAGTSTLTELSSLIPNLSYPTLKRRLAAMRAMGLVDPLPSGRPGPVGASRRLRLAVTPLTYARRWEARWGRRAPPLATQELNTALLLAVPLAQLPTSLSGTFLLSADDGDGVEGWIEGGSASARPQASKATRDAYGSASLEAWASAILEGDMRAIRLAGDEAIAGTLIAEMHNALRMK